MSRAMTAASSSTSTRTQATAHDPWDTEPETQFLTSSHSNSTPHRRQAPIRDDWENDDDDDDEEVLDNTEIKEPANATLNPPITDENVKIWDAANQTAPAHMPQVIVLPRNAPPPSALQSQIPMRILKRPSNGPSTPIPPSSNDANTSAAALKEREKQYLAARERIFGENPKEGIESPSKPTSPLNSPTSKTNTKQPDASVRVLREPNGPSDSNGPAGFARRKSRQKANA